MPEESQAATPADIVHLFVGLTGRCLDLLLLEYGGHERKSASEPAMLLPRDGSRPVLNGRFGSIGRFKLHGRGCQFELDTGEDLDVDWDSGGRPVFDSWRLLMFAKSLGQKADRESLRLAAIADPSIRQVRTDSFTWINRTFDLQFDVARS